MAVPVGRRRWIRFHLFRWSTIVVAVAVGVWPAVSVRSAADASQARDVRAAPPRFAAASPSGADATGSVSVAIVATFLPDADAYVSASSPTRNYGSSSQLRVDGSPTVVAFARFTVQGLSAPVVGATLRVMANSGSSAGFEVHGMSDVTWNESAVTFETAPLFAPAVVGASGPTSGGVWAEIDVTSLIGGDGVFSFALSTPGSTAISLASRESPASPELVISTNAAPLAFDDSGAVLAGDTLVVPAPGVLANDTDPDGNPLIATLVGGVNNGLLALNGDGAFTYQPESGFTGVDTFTYEATDTLAASNLATVTITVNESANAVPVAVDDAYGMLEGVALLVAAPGVLANDSDAEADPLAAVPVGNVANGSLALSADGSFSYTPNAGFSGIDSFTYAASDALGASSPATVTIAVAANTAPVAVDDAYGMLEGGALIVAAPGVLANDTDAEADPLAAVLVGDVANGSLALSADGSLSYTPNAGFSGTDSFTYAASDALGASIPATVTIAVAANTAPVAVDDSYDATEGQTLVVPPATGVLANDSDVDGQSLSAALVSAAGSGALTLNADGSFSYTPDVGFSGLDTLTYRASDALATSNIATVTIAVAATTSPTELLFVAEADAFVRDSSPLKNYGDLSELRVDASPMSVSFLRFTVQGLTVPVSRARLRVRANSSSVLGYEVHGMTDLLWDEATVTFDTAPPFDPAVTGASGSTTGGVWTEADVTALVSGNGSYSFALATPSNTATSLASRESSSPPELIVITNIAPVASDDAYVATEARTLIVSAVDGVLANDSDANGQALAAELAGDVSSGSLILNADGSFSYTPVLGFTGSDAFTYVASDTLTASNIATAAITVVANTASEFTFTPDADAYVKGSSPTRNYGSSSQLRVDSSPVTVAFARFTVQGLPAPVIGATLRVMANSSSILGYEVHGMTDLLWDEATVTFETAPGFDPGVVGASGRVTGGQWTEVDVTSLITGNGTYSFALTTPSTTATSLASRDAASPPELVIIVDTTPNSAPTAADDAYDALGGEALVVPASNGVITNDTDPEGQSITASLAGDVSNGSLTLAPDGSFTYIPNTAFSGMDSFTYRAIDEAGAASNAATVTLTVTAAETSPVALDDAYQTQGGQTLIVISPGVLANDTDPSGQPLDATLVGSPTDGTLALNFDGSFSYTPNAGFTGADAFAYEGSNRDGATSNLATVTIMTVNTPPVALDDAYDALGGETLIVAAAGVLGNDTDVDGQPLVATLVGPASNGTLTLSPDGSLSYTPDVGFTGVDSFTYRATDSDGAGSNLATVTVTTVNTPPVALDDAYDALGGETLIVAAAGVLGNDTDVDGQPLVATLVGPASSGTLTLSPDGSLSYTPDGGFTGIDSFTYRATDSDGARSNLATVTITTVNTPPVAVDDAYDALGGETLIVAAGGVLGNDTDIDGQPLVATLVSGVGNGALVFSADGSLSYTPDVGFTGIDSFTYRATDSDGAGSNLATVTITTANTPPVAVDDAYDALGGETLLVAAAAGVLANDTDVDGQPLTAALVGPASSGTLTFSPDGSLSYTPNVGFTGVDTFTYRATDSDGAASNLATVTITTVNTPPVAVDDVYDAAGGETLIVDGAAGVLANDTDAEGQPLTVTLVDPASNGSVVLGSDGSFSYTPNAGFATADTFTYRATDAGGATSGLATVTLTRVNTAPVVTGEAYQVTEAGILVMPAPGVLANDWDFDGQPLTAGLVVNVSNGTVLLLENGSFTYTPDIGFMGSDSFVYWATDTDGARSGFATVTITVMPSSFTFTADADTFVRASSPTRNFGASTVLRVDGDPVTVTYLRFTVAGLTGPAVSAQLRVMANSSSAIGYEVHAMTDVAWDEAAVTFDTAPLYEPAAAGASGPISGGAWNEIDVTALVGGEGTYSFALVTLHVSGKSLASGESLFPPELIVGSLTPLPPIVFTAAGDHGQDADADASLALLGSLNPDFHLAVGDLSYTFPGGEQAWCDYVQSYVGAAFPFEVLVGNHEDDNRVDGWIRNFAACLPDRMDSVGDYGVQYYFDVDDRARILMLPADNQVDGNPYFYRVGSPEYLWVSATIDDARARGIPWVVVGFHKTCLTAGLKACSIGPDLFNLLVAEKQVDLIINAHEHNYQRSKQLTCGEPDVYLASCVADDGADGQYAKGAGSVVVITGAFGRGPTAIDLADPEFPYFAAWMGSNHPQAGHGFVMVTITAESLTLEFMGSDTAYTDSFTIGP